MQNTESSTTWASSADVNNDLAEANVIVSKLSDEALLKMEVIQNLLDSSDRTTYTQKLKEAAEKLGFFSTYSTTASREMGTGGFGWTGTKSTVGQREASS